MRLDGCLRGLKSSEVMRLVEESTPPPGGVGVQFQVLTHASGAVTAAPSGASSASASDWAASYFESGRRVAASLVGQSAQPIGFTMGLSIAPMVGESAPVYTPVSYAAIGNDKIGEIAQEPVMPPALTCVRGENNR
jgi:hypothetical protein